MPVIAVPPMSEPHRAALRLEVGELRRRTRCRVFDSELRVGTLGGAWQALSLPRSVGPDDQGLVCDLVETAWDGLDEVPHAWLIRAGSIDPLARDAAWLAALIRCHAARGTTLTGYWVVTRSGWVDPVLGESRTWVRLRL